MSFAQIAKEVIIDSIRSAICIDDSYASAYSDDEDLNHTEPKELYDSFRSKGKCDLDIYQFKNIEESWKKDFMLSNKDLMILDWELNNKMDPKYIDTLTILSDVINSNKIPFIVIYTGTPELQEVSWVLLEHFNYITNEINREEIVELLNTTFERMPHGAEDLDFESFLDDDDIQSLFFDYLNCPDTEGNTKEDRKNDIIYALIEEMNLQVGIKAVCNGLIRVLSAFFPGRNDLMQCLGLLALNKDDQKNDSYNILRINSEHSTFKINGTTILIYHKIEKGGVNPDDLFEVFSQAIIANPHNYLSLLSLELKDQLREEFSIIGNRFSEIDETAFFYHMQNFRDKETKEFILHNIHDFVIKSWMQDLNSHRLEGKSKVIELIAEAFGRIEEQIPKKLDKKTQESLTKYSAFISSSDIKRIDTKLKFGDIFIKLDTNEYFICITPHCDCVTPSDKINNNFYFIKGANCNPEAAIKNAEKGFYSFLNIDHVATCVEWSCKPFTAYISDDNNDINRLEFSYKNEDLKIIFATTLKENYTQRLSNESFGHGYRVGIDLPHEVSLN